MPPIVSITNLKDLLGLEETTELLNYETDYLTSVFENYGSLMVSLKVTTINKDDAVEVLQLVCKLYPPTEQWKEMFQIDRTFEKEAKLYTVVIPELQQLQQELNIPTEEQLKCFVKCCGARLEQRTEETVTEAAMVLENIKLQGYRMANRSEGFDRTHVKLILRNLAQFHAVPLVLKIKKPLLFKETILPVIEKVNLNDGLKRKEMEEIKLMFQDYFQSQSEIKHLTDRLLQQIDFCWQEQANTTVKEDPFNSISHNDFWVNNMMIKYDGNQEPISVKILDFQLTKFAPIALDLLFFLFTSINYDLLRDSFDDLIKEYYAEFIRVLKLHSCPVEEFSFDAFLDSMNHSAAGELYHLLVLLRVVHLDQNKIPEAEKQDLEMIFRPEVVGEDFYRKLTFVVLEYERRGWLLDTPPLPAAGDE